MCRGGQKCAICSRRHVVLMCPDVKYQDGVTTTPANVDDKKEKVLSNSNQIRGTDVILQTLYAKIRNNREKCVMRLIFDLGSTRSYVFKDIIRRLQYRSVNTRSDIRFSATLLPRLRIIRSI